MSWEDEQKRRKERTRRGDALWAVEENLARFHRFRAKNKALAKLAEAAEHRRVRQPRSDKMRAREKELRAAGLKPGRAAAPADTRAGFHSVVLTGVTERDTLKRILCEGLGYSKQDANVVIERVVHVRESENIAPDVSLRDAVRLKELVELLEAGKVRVVEGVQLQPGKRRSIPQAVKREVWRRDSGRCVDCGSRKRLHYDHIIPVSKGGGNTARNIELRCEVCNLKEGARI